MNPKRFKNTVAIGRVAIALIVVIIIIVAAAAAAALLLTPGGGGTTSSSSTVSNTSTTTSPTTSTGTTSTSTGSSNATSTTSSGISTTTTGSAPNTLTVDEFLWPGLGVSPFAAVFSVTGSNWWLESVYQTLVTDNGSSLYQNGTVQALPDLAVNWTSSPNGTIYTFNLRHGVSFSNGDPFNAYQVWAEWYEEYYIEGNASNFMIGYPVFNFSGVNFSSSTVALMNSSGLTSPNSQLLAVMSNSAWPIYAADAYTLVCRLKAPFAFFPEVLIQFSGVIVDSQFILKNGGYGTPSGGYNPAFDSIIVPGTGPYVLSSFSAGAYEKFTQNPNYWGKNLTAAQIQANPYLDPGHFSTIVVNAKTDDLARYTDLHTGAAQIVSIFSPDWPLVTANLNQFSYFVMPNNSLVTEGIGMNTLRYPTNITDFRLAIVHAINYSDIAQKVFHGLLAPWVGPEYSAQSQWYDLGNLPPYNYNLTLAQKYLNESGVDVSKLSPLDFRVVAGCGVCSEGAQAVQGYLQALGIPMSVEVVTSSQLTFPYVAGYGPFSIAVNDSQQEAHMTWMGYPTYAPNEPTPADSWLSWVNNVSLGGNYAIYSNPTVQKCVNGWTTISDTATLKSLCTAAYSQIYSDAPYIWLGTPKLAFGSGSIVWNKGVVKSFLLDPSFTGASTTAILNTVVPVGS